MDYYKYETSELPAPQPLWPRLQPYVVTLGIVAGFLAAVVYLGWINENPFVEFVVYLLLTVGGVVETAVRPSSSRSLSCHLLGFVWMGCAGLSSFSQNQLIISIGYGVLAFSWLCLFIHAFLVRRKLFLESLARLNRSVDRSRRALQEAT